jgi:hypothetical protein
VRACGKYAGVEKIIRRLADLFAEKDHLPIAQQKDYVRLRLPEMLSGSHLNLWRIGDPVSTLPKRVLLGFATWSLYDLKLLDALAERLERSHPGDERLDVFDVDADIDSKVHLKRRFEKYIPGIGTVLNTPAVGIWENGILKQKAKGVEARKLIVDRYKLNYVNNMMKLPNIIFHDVETAKGHWGIFVQSVVEAQNSPNIFLKMLLEQEVDEEHFRSRRLELLVPALELESLPGRNRVLDQIRNWIETTEGNGFLTLGSD